MCRQKWELVECRNERNSNEFKHCEKIKVFYFYQFQDSKIVGLETQLLSLQYSLPRDSSQHQLPRQFKTRIWVQKPSRPWRGLIQATKSQQDFLQGNEGFLSPFQKGIRPTKEKKEEYFKNTPPLFLSLATVKVCELMLLVSVSTGLLEVFGLPK